jgi:methenyltetrahydromethanopterin cyclohydrolase
MDSSTTRPSVHRNAAPLVTSLLEHRNELKLAVRRHESGATIVDAGIGVAGGLEAGRRIAEICMGGLGQVQLTAGSGRWPVALSVTACDPVISCLASQYAGWSLSSGSGKTRFHALGSGPARALAVKEPLFEELKYRDEASSTYLILEVDREPPLEVIEKVVRDCQVGPEQLTIILTPTTSMAGMVQIIARVLEVGLHKAHTLGFPLDAVVDGAASAPLAPPSPDTLSAMGRTNDAILFGGTVQLFVRCEDALAEDLAQRLHAQGSRDYGKPFATIFKQYGYDFYKIDPMLFAPAVSIVTNLASGRTFRGGGLNDELLQQSFGG